MQRDYLSKEQKLGKACEPAMNRTEEGDNAALLRLRFFANTLWMKELMKLYMTIWLEKLTQTHLETQTLIRCLSFLFAFLGPALQNAGSWNCRTETGVPDRAEHPIRMIKNRIKHPGIWAIRPRGGTNQHE